MAGNPKLLAARRQARKKDALALAELIYDMFKEEEQRKNYKIEDGQNNAQSINSN